MSAPVPSAPALRERLVDGAYALGWSVLKHLPEPVARGLFDQLADFTWRKRGKGVRQLERNLSRVHPGAGEERLRELSRAGMRSYLRYWLEAFRLPTWSRARISEVVQAKGLENLTGPMEAGRGVVAALPHMANWDLAGAWIVGQGHPFTTVAERLKPESLFDRFVAYRESLGMEVLPLTGGGGSVIGTLARRLRAGRLVCLVGDRDLSDAGIPVEFFGEQTKVPAGPAALAVRTGAALVPATLWYDGPVMRVEIHPELPVPEEGDQQSKVLAMTQALADVWADGIREHSEDWHMLQKFWLADLGPRRTA
ncbi:MULTISPECIES: phosphatidylinositol mannoside acyltransferase [Kitasatospora]|uniref:Phosphatidylinositol mannoside acyltransferase n=1 Tax=Kitasatospora cystarginea TaxID=58350 RepID=A0ABN3E4X7_9ACTN